MVIFHSYVSLPERHLRCWWWCPMFCWTPKRQHLQAGGSMSPLLDFSNLCRGGPSREIDKIGLGVAMCLNGLPIFLQTPLIVLGSICSTLIWCHEFRRKSVKPQCMAGKILIKVVSWPWDLSPIEQTPLLGTHWMVDLFPFKATTAPTSTDSIYLLSAFARMCVTCFLV